MTQNLSSTTLPAERPITPVIDALLEAAIHSQTAQPSVEEGSSLMVQNTAQHLASLIEEGKASSQDSKAK